MRTQQLLNIMEAFLDALKYEQMCEAFGWEDPIDFMCDDSEDDELSVWLGNKITSCPSS